MEEENKKQRKLQKGTLAYEHFMAYQRNYKKEHRDQLATMVITLNRAKDKDILEYRKKFPRTWNSLIKQLIRDDIAKNK